jgi:hypothetical protein
MVREGFSQSVAEEKIASTLNEELLALFISMKRQGLACEQIDSLQVIQTIFELKQGGKENTLDQELSERLRLR